MWSSGSPGVSVFTKLELWYCSTCRLANDSPEGPHMAAVNSVAVKSTCTAGLPWYVASVAPVGDLREQGSGVKSAARGQLTPPPKKRGSMFHASTDAQRNPG